MSRSRSYRHVFVVDASLEKVRDFHINPGSMAAITPPGIRVRHTRQPSVVAAGEEMEFDLCFGPFTVPWKAGFETVTATGFVDRQLHGPFDEWVHKHIFRALDDGRTAVVDEVSAVFGSTPWRRVVSRSMWLGMPMLFAFRSWKTRSVLERSST